MLLRQIRLIKVQNTDGGLVLDTRRRVRCSEKSQTSHASNFLCVKGISFAADIRTRVSAFSILAPLSYHSTCGRGH